LVSHGDTGELKDRMLLAGWLARVLGLVDISKPQGDRVLDTLEKMLARAHPSLVSARNVSLALVAMSLLLVAWPPVAEGGHGGDTPRRMLCVFERGVLTSTLHAPQSLRRFRKETFSRPASDSLRAEIVASCQYVICALAD
jgi:hypothetical protein